MASRRPSDASMIVDAISHAASAAFSVSVRSIVAHTRHVSHVRARWAVAWVARQSYGLSLNEIGRRLGRRHHTSILHAVRQAGQLIEGDGAFRSKVEVVEKKLDQVNASA